MSSSFRSLVLTGMLLSLCVAPVAAAAYDDPSGRVARLNHSQGEVSYSPSGEDDWINVERNRPLIRGDRLWTDSDARAELQMGSAVIRLGADTDLEILELNDRIAQVQITQGTINLRVRRIYPGQIYEVATPTLAFVINRVGRYRIDVDPYDDQTTIVVWEGAGEAYGDNAEFPLRSGDAVRFYGADLRDYEMYGLPRADGFDRYCLDRDQRLDRSVSLRFLREDVAGYQDLDAYGNWRPVGGYGNVWFPNRVDAGWAPYQDGYWVWQEPWGWTWIDDAPWGFAPSHYGRWTYVGNRWGWIPGPRNLRPTYAPALVAFVGGRGWSGSLSAGGGSSPIGWFPLGPREVYVPSYQSSRDYFTRVNVNNTVINTTTINNVYNNYSSGTINVNQVNYANRSVAGAMTAVPSSVFMNAGSVREAAIRLDRNAASTGQVTRVAPIAPNARSVLGSEPAARTRPSREALERRVFARNAPPPDERPFATRQQRLQQTPGRAPQANAAAAAPNRNADGTRNVRVIADQSDAVNAREAGPRRGRGRAEPTATAATAGQLPTLDRSNDAGNRPPGERRERRQRDEPPPQENAVPLPERERQAAERQRAEAQRQAELQTQEQQRTAERERSQQANEQQRVERQRLAEAQQQRQLDRTREQQAAEQQRTERQRLAEAQQATPPVERVRGEQAAEQRRAERQRLAEAQAQQQPPPVPVESVRGEQAAEPQRAEPERQAQRQAQREQRQAERERAAKEREECLRRNELAVEENRGNRADDPMTNDPCEKKVDKPAEGNPDDPKAEKQGN